MALIYYWVNVLSVLWFGFVVRGIVCVTFCDQEHSLCGTKEDVWVCGQRHSLRGRCYPYKLDGTDVLLG